MLFLCQGPRRKAVIPNPGAGVLHRRSLMELCVQQWSGFPHALNQASLLSAFLEGLLCLPTITRSRGDQPHPPKVSFYQYPSPAQYWPLEIPRSSGKYLTTVNLGRVTWKSEVSFPKRCQKNPMNSLMAESSGLGNQWRFINHRGLSPPVVLEFLLSSVGNQIIYLGGHALV